MSNTEENQIKILAAVSKYDVLVVNDKKNGLEIFNKVLLPTYNLYFAYDLNSLTQVLDSKNNINLIIINTKYFLDFLPCIKKHPIYYNIPVVVCTDVYNHADISKALSGDVFDVWKKPLNPDLVFFRTFNIINRHSMTDKKTGLFTQESFITRAEKILKQNPYKTYYIIRYDIDNFKLYNHNYGIEAGDELLRFLGNRSNALSTADSIFCRWEKDHFVGLVEERYLASKNIIRYLTQLEQEFHHEYKMYIRMGLYKIEDPSLPIIQMCDKALLAHRASKKDLSSMYAFFDERLFENQIEEQKITDEMENALQEEQFVIYLQPQYNQATMCLYGAEALVRWNHPTRGIITPGNFIPLFERNGFILKLDRYIFRKVCELQRTWLDNGYTIVPISVNLSRAEALNENLCDELLQIVNEYHLSPKYINLEITESAYMDNPNQVVNLTKRLQEAGFELEMDDFGSGYSSLNTLKEIPVDVLKLDLKFLYGDDSSNRTTQILSSIIRMAHGMSMPIIAEGVETFEQANFLKSLGCFYIQGFYFDKPMPASEFEQRLKEIHPDNLKKNRFVVGNSSIDNVNVQSLLSDFLGPAAIIEYDEKNIEGFRCNTPFYGLFDFNAQDYIEYHLNLRTNFDDENYLIIENTIKRAIKTNGVCECEVLLLPKKNKKRPKYISLKMNFLRYSQGIYSFYVRVKNMDAEKARQKELFNIRRDIYSVADTLPGGAISLNYKDGVYFDVFINDGIATMLGISVSQYYDKTKNDPFFYVHKDDKKRVLQEVQDIVFNSDTFYKSEYRLVAKNGEINNVQIFCKIEYLQRGVIHAVATVLNVEEREKKNSYINKLEKEIKSLRKQLANNGIQEKIEEKSNDQLVSKNLDVTELYLQKDLSQEIELAEKYGKFATYKYSFLKNSFITMSDSLPKLFGYSYEEFIEKFNNSFLSLIFDEDSSRVWASIQEQQKKQCEEFMVEHRIKTKSGELKWVRGRFKKIIDEFGNEYYPGILIDIDKEKEIENKLAAQNFTLSSLEENIEGATVRYKINGNNWKIDFVSKNNEQLFGCPIEEIYKKLEENQFAFAHPDDVEKIGKETNNTIKKDSLHIITFRIIRSDGTIRWLKARGKYYRKTKDTGFLVITCYDITEQQEIQAKIFEEKQRLQNLVDAIPGGVSMFEIRPDKLKVQYVSSKVSMMFGLTKEEFTRNVEEDKNLGVFEQDAPRVFKVIKQLEINGQPFNIDFRVEHKDGYLVWVSMNAVKTGMNNGNPVFISVFQNKTKHTNTLDNILSKILFHAIVFDVETKEVLYANPQAEIFVNKHLNPFNPIHISNFLYDKMIDEFEKPIPDTFERDEYFAFRRGRNYKVTRFRVDWNGRDSIFVLAEEIFDKK